MGLHSARGGSKAVIALKDGFELCFLQSWFEPKVVNEGSEVAIREKQGSAVLYAESRDDDGP